MPEQREVDSVDEAFVRFHQAILFAAAGALAEQAKGDAVAVELSLRVRVDPETDELVIQQASDEGSVELYRVVRP